MDSIGLQMQPLKRRLRRQSEPTLPVLSAAQFLWASATPPGIKGFVVGGCNCGKSRRARRLDGVSCVRPDPAHYRHFLTNGPRIRRSIRNIRHRYGLKFGISAPEGS